MARTTLLLLVSLAAGCGRSGSPESSCFGRAVFVSPAGDDAASGRSAGRPVRTLQRAFDIAVEEGIHAVIAAQGNLGGVGNLPGHLALRGGMIEDFSDCEPAGRTQIDGLRADTVVSSSIEGIDLVGLSATSAGGSSYAVFVRNSVLSIADSDLFAGDGMAGAVGAQGGIGLTGSSGQLAIDAETDEGTEGGLGGIATACPNGPSGAGAAGGDGGDNNQAGDPGDTAAGGGGGGGGGGVGGNASGGGEGGEGDEGEPGAFGLAEGLLDADSFWIPLFGNAGEYGLPGTGGGGGGGGGGGNDGGDDDGGGGGGGGGSGGCGGEGGAGGQGGGGSFGLFLVDSTVTLTRVEIRSANGGDGGAGGPGGSGGAGGNPGAGGEGSDEGGDGGEGGVGGAGGTGGEGGGGAGGPSVAIWIVGAGSAVTQDAETVLVPGAPGAGAGDAPSGIAAALYEAP